MTTDPTVREQPPPPGPITGPSNPGHWRPDETAPSREGMVWTPLARRLALVLLPTVILLGVVVGYVLPVWLPWSWR